MARAPGPSPLLLAGCASRILLWGGLASGKLLPHADREVAPDAWGLLVAAIASVFLAPPSAIGLLLSCLLGCLVVIRFDVLTRSVLPPELARRAWFLFLLWPGTTLMALPGVAAALVLLLVEVLIAADAGRTARASFLAAGAALLWPPAAGLGLLIDHERRHLSGLPRSALWTLLPLIAGALSLFLARPSAPADLWAGPLLLAGFALVGLDRGWFLWGASAAVALAFGLGMGPSARVAGVTAGSALLAPSFLGIVRTLSAPGRLGWWWGLVVILVLGHAVWLVWG